MFMKNYSPGGQDMFGEGILEIRKGLLLVSTCWPHQSPVDTRVNFISIA